MSAMTALEICYPLMDQHPTPVFVFPSLLPVLDPAEVDPSVWRSSTDRTIFGRRYVLQNARGFPPTLLLHFFRRLHAVAERVDLVRRDHFLFALFGAGVVVRFNSAPVGIRASSGQCAVALDIAVSVAVPDLELGCRALDRITLELALTLASEEQFRPVRLTKYGLASYQPADDPSKCPPEQDAFLGDLVWADPLRTSKSASVADLAHREPLWWNDDWRRHFFDDLRPVHSAWLDALPNAVKAHIGTPTTEQVMWLFRHNEFLDVLTDPFWVTEHLPPNLPDCLLQPPRRFGHLPRGGGTPMPASSAPHAPAAHLFEDHSVTVSHNLLSGGRFGNFCLQGRELGGFGRAVVIRAIRGAAWDAQVAAGKFTATSTIPFRHVVPLVLPCKVTPDQELVILPLAADAFELTLAEFLADESTDEQTCLGVLFDVASGLHELHSRSLIHGRLTIERSVVVSRIPGSPRRPFAAKVRFVGKRR